MFENKGKTKSQEVVGIALPKKEIAGLSLEEILGVGLGITNNISIVGDPAAFIGKLLAMKISFKDTINGYTSTAYGLVAGILKEIDGGVGSLDQSPTYHKLVNETSELFKYHSRNLTFDGVNLAGDLALIKLTKGRYRKAAIGKTAVDGGLLAKDIYLVLKDKGTITAYFKEIVAGSPYPSRQAVIEKGKEILFGKVFPYLSYAKERAAAQFPINIVISVIAGVVLFAGAYILERREKLQVKEYTTDVV